MQVLSDAIKTLEGHIQNQKLEEAKELLVEKLKGLSHENFEDRAIIYYYLLRTYLQGEVHIENAILIDYYEKMVTNFRRQEQKYKEEIAHLNNKKLEGKVQLMQYKAFYKLVERYFSSLELLYGKKDFHETRQKAFLEKMRYRKNFYRLKQEYINVLGYFMMDMTSQYGTSFVRWGITTLLFILFFGWLFMVIDMATTGGHMIKGGALYNYFYFSVVAFTTVGFGDITPVTGIEKLLVAFEILSGYVMLGMLINLIQRKLR
jgi:hypothetical protein